MCTRDVHTRTSSKPREGAVSKLNPSRQRGLTAVGLVTGITLSLALAVAAFMVFRGYLADPGRHSELGHELNLAMQLMRRDISRAGQGESDCDNDSGCFGTEQEVMVMNAGLSTSPANERPAAVVVDRKNDCVFFEFDRDRDGRVGSDEFGAYRREVVGGIGVIALWMGDGAPDCADPNPWAPVSDASVIDIDTFSVAKGMPPKENSLGQLHLRLGGRLVADLDSAEVVEATIAVPDTFFL
jgi:type II secretory pathway component PulJ